MGWYLLLVNRMGLCLRSYGGRSWWLRKEREGWFGMMGKRLREMKRMVKRDHDGFTLIMPNTMH